MSPAETIARLLQLGFSVMYDPTRGELRVEPRPPEKTVEYLFQHAGDVFAAVREFWSVEHGTDEADVAAYSILVLRAARTIATEAAK